ncbi:tetratricopeptide repeat protein 23 [Conger conger]|uniref:tetratricopeptide repeat protein 23 n=1 Tax=Conger conger TaxID=82655 RepID=UPI002A5A7BD5|nr:tetratricopeptide repeat protein 23 [Conger conger]
MKSFHLSDSDMSKYQDSNLAGRRESTTESSSGGSGRSTHSEKGLSSHHHGGVAEIVAAAMAGPREKLAESERKAQTFVESQQVDAAIQEQVRCLALVRLVYGEGHLRLAEAHAKLAEGYLQLKGWAQQAREHSVQAQDILHLRSPGPAEQGGEKAKTLRCLLSVCHTQGQAALVLGDLEEAEASLKTAERIVGDLQQQEGAAGEETTAKTEFEISTALSRLCQRQGRPEVALCQCKRALRLAERRLGTAETCAVYRDMAAIEQAEGRLDKAIRHLQQAHSLAQSRDPGGLEEARIAHSLALAHSTLREPGHKDSALRFFEESLAAYSRIVGTQDALTLSVQDDLSHLLLLIGQQENAVRIQRESLAPKRSVFGDLSEEVADTLQLIGGVEMTQGDMRRAHKSMSKCLEIQKLLLGPQHKKTKATQRTVDMLSEAPEVAGRQQKAGSLKTRPPFCAVIPSHNAPGGTNVAPFDS